MGNYAIFLTFENPRRGRQARDFTTNVPKILDLKSSSEQIFSENWRWVPLNCDKYTWNENLRELRYLSRKQNAKNNNQAETELRIITTIWLLLVFLKMIKTSLLPNVSCLLLWSSCCLFCFEVFVFLRFFYPNDYFGARASFLINSS